MFVALLSNRDKNLLAGRAYRSGGFLKRGIKADFDKIELLTYINVVISRGDKLIEHLEDVVGVLEPSWIESRSN